MFNTMNLRLEDDHKARPDKPADATQHSESSLAAQAMREVEVAIEQANAGDFASEAEVSALAQEWKVDAGQLAADNVARA